MPSVSLAFAVIVTVAGAGNVAPLAGAVNAAVGAWLTGAGVRTTTLSNTPVATVEALWLVTASPTYIVAVAIVIVPTDVHVTPSLDWNAVTTVPRRSSRTQYGAPGAPVGVPLVTLPAAGRS